MNKLYYITLVFCFTLSIGRLFPQTKDSTVTVNALTVGLKKEKVLKFLFSFDARRSFVSAQHVRISGIKLGFQYKEKFKAGIGFYSLASFLTKRITVDEGTSDERIVDAKLNFGYMAYFYEHIFYKKKRWIITAPVVFGLGDIKLTYFNLDSTKSIDINKKTIALIEPSLMIEYKFLKWASLGGGVGVRKMLWSNKLIDANFNSPIYIIKVKIYIGELYKGIFRKKKNSTQSYYDSFYPPRCLNDFSIN